VKCSISDLDNLQAKGAWDTVIESSKDGDAVIEVQNWYVAFLACQASFLIEATQRMNHISYAKMFYH
jgi:hypothetical protein